MMICLNLAIKNCLHNFDHCLYNTITRNIYNSIYIYSIIIKTDIQVILNPLNNLLKYILLVLFDQSAFIMP